jgi:ribose-phosphate pyrophosphokinase
MNLIGDVKGKVAVMVDDMIDTAGESHIPWLAEPLSCSFFSFIYIQLFIDKIFMFSFAPFLGTIAKGAELLHQEGAREVYACTTHAVFRYLY